MTERYCEGERFADLSFTEETFEDCDFTDCVFADCSFTKCELDHTTLNECKFVRCEITGLRSTHSSVQSLDFEDCRLQEIEWASRISRARNFTKRNSTSVTCARRISGMPPVIGWTFWAAA